MRTASKLNSLLACALLAAVAGCSTPPAATQTGGVKSGADASAGNDIGGGSDTGATTDTGTAGQDTGAKTDGAIAADTTTADSTAGDTAAMDGSAGDTAVSDSAPTDSATKDTTVSDTKPGETTSSDATSSDTTSKDTTPADTAPAKCTSNADCSKGFGDCISGSCDLATGKCGLKIAADGATCKLGGLCGGTGTCKQGACAAASACDPVDCAPKPLACGAKVVIDPTKLGPSATSAWPCTGTVWAGGEQFYALSADATMSATVNLAADATDSAVLVLLGSASKNICAPQSCTAKGQKLVVGLPTGVTQVVGVETKAGATAALTLTVTCAAKTKCGDGQCNEGEDCNGCPTDCGVCATCGDKNCDAAKENCGSCPDDCGACPAVPTECKPKSSGAPDAKGCGGCACEDCVCKADAFCCQTAWDSLCVSECSDPTTCKGPKCPTIPTWCGDKSCNNGETPKTCPQDCQQTGPCGDGFCEGSETCTSCPGDCGSCAGLPVSGCGNGKCDNAEHCGVCPKDCGVCSTDCGSVAAKATPGCPGCKCEAAVCAKDPYCCKNAWDGLCVNECAAEMTCPKDACGDGVCSGSETCDSCKGDCGACVCGDGKCNLSESDTTCPADCIKCGDGKCSAGENITNCKVDCGGGCENKCGSSSKDPATGQTCWCDDACTEAGDCCPDKAKFCP